jgi:hypothetical protein
MGGQCGLLVALTTKMDVSHVQAEQRIAGGEVSSAIVTGHRYLGGRHAWDGCWFTRQNDEAGGQGSHQKFILQLVFLVAEIEIEPTPTSLERNRKV